MKQNTKDALKSFCKTLFFTCLVVVCLVGILYVTDGNSRTCYDAFGDDGYGISDSIFISKYSYERIDSEHFNCCFDEYVELTDEGYYAKEKCRGFKK